MGFPFERTGRRKIRCVLRPRCGRIDPERKHNGHEVHQGEEWAHRARWASPSNEQEGEKSVVFFVPVVVESIRRENTTDTKYTKGKSGPIELDGLPLRTNRKAKNPLCSSSPLWSNPSGEKTQRTRSTPRGRVGP